MKYPKITQRLAERRTGEFYRTLNAAHRDFLLTMYGSYGLLTPPKPLFIDEGWADFVFQERQTGKFKIVARNKALMEQLDEGIKEWRKALKVREFACLHESAHYLHMTMDPENEAVSSKDKDPLVHARDEIGAELGALEYVSQRRNLLQYTEALRNHGEQQVKTIAALELLGKISIFEFLTMPLPRVQRMVGEFVGKVDSYTKSTLVRPRFPIADADAHLEKSHLYVDYNPQEGFIVTELAA